MWNKAGCVSSMELPDQKWPSFHLLEVVPLTLTQCASSSCNRKSRSHKLPAPLVCSELCSAKTLHSVEVSHASASLLFLGLMSVKLLQLACPLPASRGQKQSIFDSQCGLAPLSNLGQDVQRRGCFFFSSTASVDPYAAGKDCCFQGQQSEDQAPIAAQLHFHSPPLD